jgi:hypothetical protein
MLASDEIYVRACIWLQERKEHQLIEVRLDLDGYGWEELLDIDCAGAMVILTINKGESGQTYDVACDINAVTALRRSPAEYSPD